ncbi:hypothetical protein HanRHA438_Chr13g0607251 [Helianthus annuus]|nr:hypothetical protein HanHA300_Chr13g0489361 [Helianthus annuus]KAJ0481998.1 hypothetical protein HanIR_Chr13g0649001 [Helianthus annuus]KAJ0498343.1 hypothetical protein HanHA89_Chr13g0521501 [Helianthus annuus]KAJ0664353.1 hypothetical protein HanLR1_Chr13g0491431 [Helianthus annuus]KAJ0671816.1 hypothetical protein HanOQP8_Chr13g0489921 [Helianthus annuus]
MSNKEGSSSHAVSQQGNPSFSICFTCIYTLLPFVFMSISEIHVEEREPILPRTVKILLDFVDRRQDKDKFSSIFEVPRRLREVNPSSFTPRVVSIGPLHKGRENLKLMEDKKASFLHEFLTGVPGSREETLKKCDEQVRGSVDKIRRCYFGMKPYSEDELVQMMVMDACFILQFIDNLSKSGDQHSENRLRSRSVALDLVLLENQIPFFVLRDIYELTFKTLESKPSLNTMLLNLLERVNPFFEKLKVEDLSGEEDPYHILGFLHDFYQIKNSKPPGIEELPRAHSAVELHEVGVRFRPNENETPNENRTWIMAMAFEQSSHKPTLRMPKVLIDNFFEVALRNLIAYEQYSTPVRNYVTSYAMAMDMLAATPADIARLGKSGVIVNHLGSNEKASNMISSICKDVTFLDFYYIESWNEAKKYYDSYWSKNIGVLKRKYFSTPWKAIALLAGIILFLIAVVQFVFRVIKFTSLR